MAISASRVRVLLPMPPVAGSMKAGSEEPPQNAPFRTSWDSTTPAKSVASAWVRQPAIVKGAEAPPIAIVPGITGTPHSAPRTIWSQWVSA